MSPFLLVAWVGPLAVLANAPGWPSRPNEGRRCAAPPGVVSTVPRAAFAAPSLRTGSATSKVYVADELQGTVSVIDAVTWQRIAAIPLAYSHPGMMMTFAPHNVQAAPDGRTVWVSAPPQMGEGCAEDGDTVVMVMPTGMPEELVVIDPLADTILARVVISPAEGDSMLHLAHVVLDRDSRYAYVSAYAADQVIRIDARTFAEVQRYELGDGRGPHGMRFCGPTLVTANLTGHSISLLNPESGAAREVWVSGAAVQIACTGDGRFAFVTLYNTREVVRYELATGELVRIALPGESRGPIQLYLRPDDRRLYVADQGVLFGRPASNKLYEIDLEKGAVSREVRLGRAPHGVVVSDDGRWAYVTNLWDANISVVDLEKWDEVAMVPTGTGPNGITFWNGIRTAVSNAAP
jgi:YVTN family beta-propeller protein